MRSAMEPFRLAAKEVAAARARAALLAESAATQLLQRPALADEEAAALLLAPDVSTEDLLAIARARRSDRTHLETFSPLYLTNDCDAECLMCGMRRTNDDLVRETADDATAD